MALKLFDGFEDCSCAGGYKFSVWLERLGVQALWVSIESDKWVGESMQMDAFWWVSGSVSLPGNTVCGKREHVQPGHQVATNSWSDGERWFKEIAKGFELFSKWGFVSLMATYQIYGVLKFWIDICIRIGYILELVSRWLFHCSFILFLKTAIKNLWIYI